MIRISSGNSGLSIRFMEAKMLKYPAPNPIPTWPPITRSTEARRSNLGEVLLQSSAAVRYGRSEVWSIVAGAPCGHAEIGRQCEPRGYQHSKEAVHYSPRFLNRPPSVTESTFEVEAWPLQVLYLTPLAGTLTNERRRPPARDVTIANSTVVRFE